ncbi:MAG: glycosyltransferase family 4 protein [Desulfovibrio sp.]
MGNKPVIAMVLKGYPRISETFISNEILQLERLGFDIRIVSMRRPRESFCHDSVKRIKAPVVYLPSAIRRQPVRLLKGNLKAFAKWPARYLRTLGQVLLRFSHTRSKATLKHFFQAGLAASDILSDPAVDRIHAHFAHSPTSVALFAHSITGLPFGFTGHAKDIYTQKPKRLVDKMKQADLVVTCTKYNKRFLEGLDHTLRNKPVAHAYHGIDTSLFAFRGAEERLSTPLRILSVSRMVPKKGMPVLLEALKLLQDMKCEFEFVHIGGGDPDAEQQLFALADELGIARRISWLGTLPHDQVVKELNKAGLFAIACEIAENGDRDGLPNVIAESMAVGLPVVATRVSAIPEIVEDRVTGLLAESGSAQQLASAIIELQQNNELRKSIVKAARRRVEDMFESQECVGRLATIFEKHVSPSCCGNEHMK